MSKCTDQRLRQHPTERFASAAQRFDLNDAATELLQEAQAGQQGHRQTTLFRHGPTTLALFCFEQQAKLVDHVVEGVVIIEVLAGKLIVTADDRAHELAAHQVLVLAPGMRHDVAALEKSQMLLTVCLED